MKKAMRELANRYDYGSEDCEQDFTEAKSGMIRGEVGNTDALCVLGYYALNGITQDVDLDQAADYFQTAIDAGSERAYVGLARTYLAGYGDEADRPAKAYENINLAYQKGIPVGQYYMAYLLENGIGCAQDYAQAMSIYEQVQKSKTYHL